MTRGGEAALRGEAAGIPGSAPLPVHSLATDRIEASLDTNATLGLSPEEAARRLPRVGPNELPQREPPTFLALLAAQFREFLVLLLLGAAVVSAALGEWLDAVVIAALVVLNAAVGVLQEFRASRALAELRRLAAPEARAVRGGREMVVASRDLVPGDLVVLEPGALVPADVRLTESANLQTLEAALTGESTPVEKDAQAVVETSAPVPDRLTMAWMATPVTRGRGRGIVAATGRRTQVGQIAAMLEEDRGEATPLQKKLAATGRWLGIAALVICAAVFLAGVLGGRDLLTMFLTAVSLAIAAVPEGLPAIVTVCLALGMREMVRRHALVRRLSAVETLGAATVICTDKTGTLTRNRMTVERLWVDGATEAVGEGIPPSGGFGLLLQAALLASDAPAPAEHGRQAPFGDPTEVALVAAAARAGILRAEAEAAFPRVAEVPFDSERKRMSTLHRVTASEGTWNPGTAFVAFVKGAPDLLLQRCSHVRAGAAVVPLDSPHRAAVLSALAGFAQEALRVIGVAFRPVDQAPRRLTPEIETDLTFLGLLAMLDPPREEAAAAVETARRAGIRVAMATGDYPQTALTIARRVGLVGEEARVLSGDQIDALDDTGLQREVEATVVFARVSPQHKVRLVQAFQRRGEIVGMTGDGVNDAPALKRADIGIAMGASGTDVARETADMVLTDDNFASIVSAVEQGRVIFSNIRKFISFLLTCNAGEIGTILIGTLLGWPVPLTAIQLLWMNLLTDGAPALALGREPEEPGTMERPPRSPTLPLIDRSLALALAVQGIVITAASLLAFRAGAVVFGSTEAARTMAFVTLAGCQVLRAYTSRSERASVVSIGVWSNRWMQYAALSSAVLLLAAVYVPGMNTVFNAVPLTLAQWACLAPLLVLPAAVEEITKAIRRARLRAASARSRP